MGLGAYPLRPRAGRESTVAEVAAAMRSARRITAFCHERPDADTLGAATACALIGERLGAEAEVVCADSRPSSWPWLTRTGIAGRPGLEPDLAIACDCASIERIGFDRTVDAAWLAGATLVNIDHHVGNARFGDLNLVNPDAAATCEIVLELMDCLGIEPDADLGTVLLAGIVRDTRGFSDPSTSPATLRAAARLVDAGAPLAIVQRAVLANQSQPAMLLWGRVLSGIRRVDECGLVYAEVTCAMVREAGASTEDAEGLVELLASGRGVDIAILAREIDEGRTRISVRSGGSASARDIAAAFGGGGHHSRAGCVIAAGTEASVRLVVDEALRQVAASPPASTG